MYRRVFISIILSLLFLGVGYQGYLLLASLKKPPEEREQTIKTYIVTVFDVEELDIQELIAGFGTTGADRDVLISAQVSGEVVEIHPELEVGQYLETPSRINDEKGPTKNRPGDLVVRIDPQNYQELVLQAERQLEEIQADIVRLKQEEKNNQRVLKKTREDLQTITEEYDRIKKLKSKNIASSSQFSRAVLELSKYREALIRTENQESIFPLQIQKLQRSHETLKARLRIAELNLSRTSVFPPFSGTIRDVMVEKGEFVNAGSPLIRMIDNQIVELAIPVKQDDYLKLEPLVQGKKYPVVEISENEIAPVRWYGQVVRVAPNADENTRTINVYVEVDNSEQKVPLLPGTFVHALINGPIHHKIKVIPRDAIIKKKVFVAKNGLVEEREIEILSTHENVAVIKKGLSPGDQLIITNLDVIFQGATVKIESHKTLKDEVKNKRARILNSN
jgi:RND family efflux transporter MFP subunit